MKLVLALVLTFVLVVLVAGANVDVVGDGGVVGVLEALAVLVVVMLVKVVFTVVVSALSWCCCWRCCW